MARKPLEWRADDPDGLDVPLTGKGLIIQFWGRDPEDAEAVVKGIIAELDSKGALERYTPGCGPSAVNVVCKVICLDDCELEVKKGTLSLPPGTVRIGSKVVIDECCTCE